MAEVGANRKKVFTPREAMALAILEGHKGAGLVSPNPLVGCVILDEDRLLLNSGYHKKYGGPHAEIEAMKGISQEQLQGAHMYVTLEPCAHQGQTPACAEKLATLGLASVTYGMVDPNPKVSGKGIEILKKAGVQTILFEEYQEELESLAEVFLHNMRTKKPFVALKVASSLDGQMGLKSGDSKWITNEKSRVYAHYLRGVYDAIIVGKRTCQIDDPSLNIRHPDFAGPDSTNKMNKIIIMDAFGELLPTMPQTNIAKTHDPEHIYFVVSREHAASMKAPAGYHIIPTEFNETTGFNLEALMMDLYARGINSVLLEGGSYVYQTFLRQKQVQRMYTFLAPTLIGSAKGLSWTSGFGIEQLSDRIDLENIHTHFFDNDVLVTGRLNRGTLASK